MDLTMKRRWSICNIFNLRIIIFVLVLLASKTESLFVFTNPYECDFFVNEELEAWNIGQRWYTNNRKRNEQNHNSTMTRFIYPDEGQSISDYVMNIVHLVQQSNNVTNNQTGHQNTQPDMHVISKRNTQAQTFQHRPGAEVAYSGTDEDTNTPAIDMIKTSSLDGCFEEAAICHDCSYTTQVADKIYPKSVINEKRCHRVNGTDSTCFRGLYGNCVEVFYPVSLYKYKPGHCCKVNLNNEEAEVPFFYELIYEASAGCKCDLKFFLEDLLDG